MRKRFDDSHLGNRLAAGVPHTGHVSSWITSPEAQWRSRDEARSSSV